MTALIAELFVPQLVQQVAQELAGEFYDGNRSNKFRSAFPDQYKYVKTQWPYFVRTARELMSEMLNNPLLSDSIKLPIYDALVNTPKYIQ